MRSLKIPDIFLYDNVRAFLNEFLELNSHRHGFSKRYLSSKLKWPTSYLPAMLKGNKSFTVARAISFGTYFKFNPIDLERLVYFAIFDSESERVKEELRPILEIKAKKRSEKNRDIDFLDAKVLFIFEVIDWLDGKARLEDIKMICAEKGISPSEVVEICRKLVDKKIIALHNSEFRCLVKTISEHDEPPDSLHRALKFHRDMCDFYKLFLNNPEGPCTYISAFASLKKSRIPEIGDRLFALRNWLQEMSEIDREEGLANNVQMFQIDLNITPAVSKKTLLSLKNSILDTKM